MRKLIPVIIFVGAIALIIIIGIVGNKAGPRSDKSQQEVAVKVALAKIDEYDLDNNYPDTASKVISINNELVGYLYGGNVLTEDIANIIHIQRKLFGLELLEINPEQQQILAAELEIERFKENNYKLIQFKSFSPEYYESNIDNCTIKVIQYTNASENNYLYYYLSKDDYGLWKIIGWELSDKPFNEAGAVSE